MTRLTTRESSILARVAQYAGIRSDRVKQRITDLLKDVSPDAQKVGRILIGEHVEGATPDLQEFASELKTRADKNRKYVQGRIQAGKSGAKTVPA